MVTPTIPHKSYRVPSLDKWILKRKDYVPSHQTDITITFNRVRSEMKQKFKVAA